jgi:ABC-2 type transport system permease protein
MSTWRWCTVSRIRTLAEKEWREAIRNGWMAITAVILFGLFTVLPLLPLAAIRPVGGDARAEAELLRGVPPAIRRHPAYAGFGGAELGQVHFGGHFLLFFLVVPAVLPGMLTSFSIVGEKRERSLEPLLATPITTAELLVGKAAAAVIPAVLLGWASFAAYAAGVTLVAVSPRVVAALLSPSRVVAVAVVGPLVALVSGLGGLVISSRVNDPRTAQSVTGLLVLPLVALAVAQVIGVLTVSVAGVVAAGIGLAALDAVLLYAAVQLFQRETILTRWR